MRAARPLRHVVPPVLAQRAPFRIQRIVDTVVGPARFADDKQAHIVVGIVDEGVADPGAGGEANAVPGSQAMEVAVDPGVRVALDDIDELLFHALGMWIGSPPTGRQHLVMDAEPLQTEDAAEWRSDAEQFIGAGVASVVRLLDVATVLDKRRTWQMLYHGAYPTLI